MGHRQQGFTLIEIAIVLVIIGLLLGGVLKGQELITSARVRNLISLQDGVKAAFFGFQDRFRSLPGDYTQATVNIVGATSNGNGNGRIEIAAVPVGGSVPQENVLVWEHLSRSGFITGSYTFAAAASDSTSPKNPYGVYLDLAYDAVYGLSTATNPARHSIKSGGQIPVEIISEVDRKVDDGLPYTGGFQFSAYAGNAAAAPTDTGASTCVTAAAPVTASTWASTSGQTNCGGGSLL
ncbi:MAG: prepilin-type N-terminal cleavage/methylation domain-containing protein [Burkholderiales bacterium]